ncbi:MAG TPA: hypothetical protein VEZ47_01790 [Gemmatirosa sp.]|nr:hypothetical protein [Gemmatirosa sp.]
MLAHEETKDRAARLIGALYIAVETLRNAAELDDRAAMLAAYATCKVLHGELVQVGAQEAARATRVRHPQRDVDDALPRVLEAARALADLVPRCGHPLQLHANWALSALDTLQSAHGFDVGHHPALRGR